MGNGLAHAFLYPLLPHGPGAARAARPGAPPFARAHAARHAGGPRLRPRALERATGESGAAAAVAPYAAELAYSYPAQADRLLRAQMATTGDLLPYAYPLFRLPVEAVARGRRPQRLHGRGDRARGARRRRRPRGDADDAAVPAERRRRRRRRARGTASPPTSSSSGASAWSRARSRSAWWRASWRGPPSTCRGCACCSSAPSPTTARCSALLREAAACRPRGRRRPRAARGAGRLPRGGRRGGAPPLSRPARETSAALLRALAQGRPTAVSDLENFADIPADAVVRAGPGGRGGGPAPRGPPSRRQRRGPHRARRAPRARSCGSAHSPERCRGDLRGGARARGRAGRSRPRGAGRATGARRRGRERALRAAAGARPGRLCGLGRPPPGRA